MQVYLTHIVCKGKPFILYTQHCVMKKRILFRKSMLQVHFSAQCEWKLSAFVVLIF